MIPHGLPLRAVIDSNILIDFLNGNPDALQTVAGVSDRYISVVARAEVLSGATDARATQGAHRLFAQCRMIDISIEVADAAAAIRQVSRLKLPDALIAATATTLGLPLLTRDGEMIAADVGAIIPYRLR